MKRVAIFYCKRIQNHTCVGCAKCFKAVSRKDGKFNEHNDDVEIIALTDCGDCPGLMMPRVPMVVGFVENMLGGEVDAIHFGTCILQATTHGECPLKLEELKVKLEEKLDIPVYIGTHDYY